MAKFENKELTGALFKNEYKTKDNQPDVTGSCKIGDVTYKIAGWNKTTKNGYRMVQLSFAEYVDSDEPRANNVKVDLKDEILF